MRPSSAFSGTRSGFTGPIGGDGARIQDSEAHPTRPLRLRINRLRILLKRGTNSRHPADMKRFLIFSRFLVSGCGFLVTDILHAEEIVLYDFEKDPQGWKIPDWALAKKDYVAEEIGISEFYASRNRYSLEMQVNFPVVKEWRGAYAECPVDIQDWSEYGWLEADILLPKESPKGLRAKLILTVGDDWKW